MSAAAKRRLSLSTALSVLAVTVFLLAFTPPSAVPYNATAYADRAMLLNGTGISVLAAYQNPASCAGNVNLLSKNVTLPLPLLSLPGRASLRVSLTLTYNSKIWIKSGTTMYFDGDKGWPAPGWRLGFGRIDGKYTGPDSYDHYYLISPDGHVRDLRYNSVSGLYESIDSTYMNFNEATGVLRTKDGTQTTYQTIGGSGGYAMPTQIKERNGNYITINYTGTGQQMANIVDTLGRTVSFSYNPDGTLQNITKSGFDGATRTWSFGYADITLTYNFGSLTVNGPGSGSQIRMLTSVTYPNGTKHIFTYSSYGQLTEANWESSTGALRGKPLLVTWQPTPEGGWTDSPTPVSIGHNDGTATNTWSVDFLAGYTLVIHPGPTQPWRAVSFNSAGLVIEENSDFHKVNNSWTYESGTANPRVTSAITTLKDVTPNQQSKVEYDYTSFGNVSEVREFDFGLTLLKRRTTTTYITDSNYTSRHILGLPDTVIVYNGAGTAKSRTEYDYDQSSIGFVSGASNHDGTNYGTVMSYRGNVTTVTQYKNAAAPSGPITNTTSYDMLGNMVTESADCCIQKVYQFSSATQFSQPDSVVRGSGTTLTTSATYDSHTSLLASSTDENNKTTTYSYDMMDRTTVVTRSDGTQTTTSYDDASAVPSTTTTTPIDASISAKQKTELDGLGRTIRVTTMDAANTVHSKVDTLYDSRGRTWRVSNPYVGASASYWTETQYDEASRPLRVIPPDGTAWSNRIVYTYVGDTTTVEDQTGSKRKFQTDALGRQVKVIEPDPASSDSLTLETAYTYDPMDRVTQITQGAQTRTYVYDDAGRKTSETTPEAGTVSYQYNNDGLMTERTDARGAVTTYGYDTSLNRLTSISYNVSACSSTVPATPTVTYTYGTSVASNNNGRLIKVTDGPGEENYSYDALGRTTQVQKKINDVTYTTSYTYNLAGSVVTTTYPSGLVVKQEYDDIGRLKNVKNNGTGAVYVQNATYNEANQLTGFAYGNGLSSSFGYSADRLQLNAMSYGSHLNLSYSYDQGGNNNGQIAQVTDSVDSGRSASYTYDSLHRLKTAITTGSAFSPQWGLSMSYDRYGNRTAQSVTHGSGPSHSASVSATTNRFTGGYSYDASGNMTADGVASMVYDAESRMTQSTVAGAATNYTFDGGGLRVQRVQGEITTVYIFSGSQVVAEYVNGGLAHEYIYFGAQQVALRLEGSVMRYIHQDHLSIRLFTDEEGDVVGTQGHYPYGERWYTTGETTERLFTSYDHDHDSADDYALHRFHNCRLGRFRTPDPVHNGGGPGPQGLNRYAYVAGDPVNRTDPSGATALTLDPLDPPFDGGFGVPSLCNSFLPGGCPRPRPLPPPLGGRGPIFSAAPDTLWVESCPRDSSSFDDCNVCCQNGFDSYVGQCWRRCFLSLRLWSLAFCLGRCPLQADYYRAQCRTCCKAWHRPNEVSDVVLAACKVPPGRT